VSVGAVLVAAGSGRRLGALGPKAFVPVAGVPLVVHAARGLLAAGVDVLVVTVPEGFVEQATTALLGAVPRTDLWVVEGGPTRQASVALGLAALDDDVDTVVVHDAARAFAPPSLVAQVIDAVRSGHGAVVPGLPVVDTTKRVGPADASGARPVLETPDRDSLVAVQTPQGFDRALLDRAHAAGAGRACDETTAASDDAGLVESLGEPVWVVPGDLAAWKITTRTDLARAERLASGEKTPHDKVPHDRPAHNLPAEPDAAEPAGAVCEPLPAEET